MAGSPTMLHAVTSKVCLAVSLCHYCHVGKAGALVSPSHFLRFWNQVCTFSPRLGSSAFASGSIVRSSGSNHALGLVLSLQTSLAVRSDRFQPCTYCHVQCSISSNVGKVQQQHMFAPDFEAPLQLSCILQRGIVFLHLLLNLFLVLRRRQHAV